MPDAGWNAVGETETVYTRKTKRALLSGVLPPIILYWLEHDDPDDLDRYIADRLQTAMKIGQTGSKILKPVLDLAEQVRRRGDPPNP